MRTNPVVLFVLAAVFSLVAAAQLRAADANDQDIWSQDQPGGKTKRAELTPGQIEHWLNDIRLVDPNRAAELQKMQKENPQQFPRELRRIAREITGRQYKDHVDNNTFDGRKGHVTDMNTGTAAGGRRESARMWQRTAEFYDWLKQNYPAEAQKLDQLKKQKDQELYRRQMSVCRQRYWQIFESAETNPQLAEILKQDLELKEQRASLLKKIKATTDYAQKTALIEQLEEVVGNRFDLLLKRKQLQYQQLLERVQKLHEQIKQSEAQVQRWKDPAFKKESVKSHVESLLGKPDQFKWD
jgi:hypothetical protein